VRHQDGAALPLCDGSPRTLPLVTFEGAFHGRTLATIAAGGTPKYLEGFGPKVEGFDQVAFGDFDAVVRASGRKPPEYSLSQSKAKSG